MKSTKHWIGALVCLMAGLAAPAAFADVTIVKEGKPVAKIYSYDDGKSAVADLVNYIEQISSAKLEAKALKKGEKPAADAPVIAVGALALDLGLSQPPQTISKDGYTLQVKGNQVLLAGEDDHSTFYASTHLLETLGCRWFFDNPIGTVIPESKTITLKDVTISEKPDFLSRNIWGSNWPAASWCAHNRTGGLAMDMGHNWGWLPKDSFKDHPEWFALRGGKRTNGSWVCTSNPEVAKAFAQSIIAKAKEEKAKGRQGAMSVSVSPPDGTGYCECDKCVALDHPDYLEPSSGRPAVSDRYLKFFIDIAQQVQKEEPDVVINFYAYADYTRPPKEVMKAPSNLVAWVAPIRFCRLHSLDNSLCEPRHRCKDVVDGWAKSMSRIGWREYNYNLAECTVPFSKISVWKQDLPYMKKIGCVGLNIESLVYWHLNGVNTYLAAKMAWNADLNVDQVMDDFYTKFGGKAGPYIKAYWTRIDEAYRTTDAHAGSFYAIPAVWTDALVKACQADLDAAMEAADNDLIRQRVEMFQLGLDNAKLYLAQRDATNHCDFVKAKSVYDQWMANMDNILAKKIHPVAEYKYGYANRFQEPTVQAGYVRVTDDCKLVVQLPDEWLFRYDAKKEGENLGWGGKEFISTEGWQKVKTYSAGLDQQQVPEQLTWMWYRTTFKAPADLGNKPLHLWFGEVDGRAVKVYLNGQLVGEFPGKRMPGEVDITGKLLPGADNVVAVVVDHSAISELALGGILKPVMVYSGTPKEAAPVRKTSTE